jgi:hypothetical protein
MLKLCNQVKCLRVQIIGGWGVVLRKQVRMEQYMYSTACPRLRKASSTGPGKLLSLVIIREEVYLIRSSEWPSPLTAEAQNGGAF